MTDVELDVKSIVLNFVTCCGSVENHKTFIRNLYKWHPEWEAEVAASKLPRTWKKWETFISFSEAEPAY
jgi:hypothetical protein